MTDVLPPTPEGLERAAALLRDGEMVAFPTDTVYGVGVSGGPPGAHRRAPCPEAAPCREADPDPRGGPRAGGRGRWEADERAHRLSERFWPGALTLVLATPTGETQAFRAPDHPVALDLIRRTGPILATSANRSGEPDTLGADDVLIAFATQQDELPAVVDGGAVPGGVASTVLDLSVTPARLLREGPITRDQLRSVVEVA